MDARSGTLGPSPRRDFIGGALGVPAYVSRQVTEATNASLYVVGALHYFWGSPQLVLNGALAYGVFALTLLIGIGAWLHFVNTSRRTLGAPLSPDSVPAPSAASPAVPSEAPRVGSPLG